MTTYKAAISADKLTVYLAVGADAFPGGAISLGTFVHDGTEDPSGNHVLFHHVREILSRTKKSNPAQAAIWPDNITGQVNIVKHGPALNATYLSAAALTAAAAATVAAVVKYQPADVAASNADFNWTTSDATKATVAATGVVTGVAAGACTITATHKQTGMSVAIAMTVTA